jgi:hypothetical protein
MPWKPCRGVIESMSRANDDQRVLVMDADRALLELLEAWRE